MAAQARSGGLLSPRGGSEPTKKCRESAGLAPDGGCCGGCSAAPVYPITTRICSSTIENELDAKRPTTARKPLVAIRH